MPLFSLVVIKTESNEDVWQSNSRLGGNFNVENNVVRIFDSSHAPLSILELLSYFGDVYVTPDLVRTPWTRQGKPPRTWRP